MSDVLTAQAGAPAAPKKRGGVVLVFQLLATPAWFLGTLFGGAGRLNWARGWISVVMCVAGMSAVGLIARHYNAGLLEARANWRFKDSKPFDKLFFVVYVPLLVIQPAVAGLDAARFRWSALSFGFVYAGAILFALAMVMIAWVMAVNPYAEASVRIQTERGHRVITSGPYRIVRHPMYVGAILMYLAMPLVWGSVGALVISGIISALVIWRTGREDQILRQELAGYEAFAARTRYRLMPGLW
jgi:protein-S-isoprenylcysteine O-methyltransferase Ste14